MRPGGRGGGEGGEKDICERARVRIRARLKVRAGWEESETEGGDGTKTGKVDM